MSAELDNLLRIVLWVALIAIFYLNYRAWQNDYSLARQRPPTASVSQPLAQQSAVGAATTAAQEPEQKAAPVRVRTDVLDLDVSLIGGTLERADLLRYPREKGKPELVRLMNRDSDATKFEIDSGLAGPAGADRPTHYARFRSAAPSYEMTAGHQELRVPLQWTDGRGVTVTKTYVFRRGSYQIGVDYRIENKSAEPWIAMPYAQILRNDPKVEGSMFRAETRAFRGPALYDDKYRKLNVEDAVDSRYSKAVTGGWIAALQHHFVAAIVPPTDVPYRLTLAAQDREYLFNVVGPEHAVAPGATAEWPLTLFVGPKLQDQLDAAGPHLELVADFGIFTPIAKPLFWLLSKVHAIVGNWGWAIVIVTMLLKVLFYPLSEKTGRAMAKMRALAPRLKKLQEAHKDNREAQMHATLGLYKEEKVSPVSGCLPTLAQFPVFAALYWVLLESVEMRQAPFIGWINDLSSRDPYFILPAIMAAAMFLQMKLQGAPPSVDPFQQKVMMLMPLALSATFAVLPAGLVLYYVVNTLLTILQQWNINRRIRLAAAA
jgi:YidC/Oxa1 family membrane protein insertase